MVVVSGDSGLRAQFEPLSRAIARQGAVVHDIGWWSTPPWSSGIECIACAVRFARAEVSIEFHQALADAGYDVELTIVENASHVDLTDHRTRGFALTVQQVMEVARSSWP